MRASQAVGLLLATLLFSLAFWSCSELVATPSPPDTLAVHFVDVGQGDGILVRTTEGKVMVIVGGPRRGGFADYLAAQGVQRVDVMVATNPDADHIGGLIAVLQRFPVGEVWLNGQENTTITFEDFVDATASSGANVFAARRGDTIQLGSLPVQVLHPVEPFSSGRNNNSVVVKLTYNEVKFFFAGDMEREAEGDLLRAGLDLKATVLKLAHHGSSTSTSPAFLRAVEPRVAVYQAGKDNPYGHPHRETLAALAAQGVTVYGTDRDGTIVVRTDGKELHVVTERKRVAASSH
ncbi:MAG: MBL fold metallo-hydrolase [Chloroflexi bacterium]|nr:MBL fold metallo-hydrolase [Chloroflexota bacterium]